MYKRAPKRPYIKAGPVVEKTAGKLLEYCDLIKMNKYQEVWTNIVTKELDQLAQEICGHKGTNTIKFIHKHKVPGGRVVTCARIAVDYGHKKLTQIEQDSLLEGIAS
eukprot:12635776-Ditylum_brightwellii.AAC.1